MAEHADGVAVAAHHHVGETHIVVGGEVGGHDAGEHGLLVELNVVERLEREAEVSEKGVDPEETNDGEVPQHAVKVLVTVGAGHGHGVLVPLGRVELLDDLRLLDQGVEHVEDAVAAPCVRNPGPVRGKCVELVDELVNHIPRPVVLFQSQWPSHKGKPKKAAGGTNRWGLEIHGAF